MTTRATINPGLAGGDRSAALDRHAGRLYDRPAPIMAVVELVPVDRVMPVDEASSKDPLIRLRIETLEVATGEAEHTLREVARTLYLARTATGTLDGDGDLHLGQITLDTAAGLIGAHELTRTAAILDALIGALTSLAGCDNDAAGYANEILGLAEAATAARVAGTAAAGWKDALAGAKT